MHRRDGESNKRRLKPTVFLKNEQCMSKFKMKKKNLSKIFFSIYVWDGSQLIHFSSVSVN